MVISIEEKQEYGVNAQRGLFVESILIRGHWTDDGGGKVKKGSIFKLAYPLRVLIGDFLGW